MLKRNKFQISLFLNSILLLDVLYLWYLDFVPSWQAFHMNSGCAIAILVLIGQVFLSFIETGKNKSRAPLIFSWVLSLILLISVSAKLFRGANSLSANEGRMLTETIDLPETGVSLYFYRLIIHYDIVASRQILIYSSKKGTPLMKLRKKFHEESGFGVTTIEKTNDSILIRQGTSWNHILYVIHKDVFLD